MTDYILYGGDHSYFTGKARAYLRYKGLDFEERMATRDVYKQIILPNIGAPIIPVLHNTAADEYVQDTTDIIDYLENLHPQASVYPDGARQRLVALLLEMFGDEWLVIPAMHYRWGVLDQQYGFIMREFGRLSAPEASPQEQVAIGERTSKPFRGSIPMLGINEQTGPAIEAGYLAFLDQLNTHLEQHDFLLGSRPSIGDYGFMGPLYAHLGRDPVPKKIMQERAPAVYAWVERMNAPEPLSGDFLAGDEIPATLLPIVQTLFREQVPCVLDVVAHNSEWLAQNPGGDVPRYLGMHAFTIGDTSGERVMHSYVQWLYQRPWAHFHGLAGSDRQSVADFLSQVGGLAQLEQDIPHWLQRKAGQLELVEGKRPETAPPPLS